MLSTIEDAGAGLGDSRDPGMGLLGIGHSAHPGRGAC